MMTYARGKRVWVLAAIALIATLAVGLRLGTRILSHGSVFDEKYIRIPIDDLNQRGWSVETAIDFTETKGPALIWPYALLGEVIGGSLNDLRLITVLLFVAGAIPLLLMAIRCGIRGAELLLVAGVYALLPYNAVLGQLLMSEASFICGALWLWWLFLWGFGESAATERRIAGPILYAILLAILLHNRIHAVAFAGAVALVAWERDRFRSWPWWLAGAAAGLLRVPLMIRWGGFVSPEYQSMHGFGLRFDSLTYLGAGLSLYLAPLLWPALRERGTRRLGLFLIGVGGLIGLGLGLMAPASLALTDEFRFQGPVASAVRMATSHEGAQAVLVALLACVGLASLGAVAALAWQKSGKPATARIGRLTVWTLLVGWGLYALTRGWAFDRYLLPWAALTPILWVRWLPKWLLALSMLALAAVLAYHANVWLMREGAAAGG